MAAGSGGDSMARDCEGLGCLGFGKRGGEDETTGSEAGETRSLETGGDQEEGSGPCRA